MKLTVLTENKVLQSKNYLGEHGLSFYIEVGNKKILFDAGYSDAFIKNAHKMGIDLLDLDYIVLSHGHYDHTWGLSHYLPFYDSAIKNGRVVKKPLLITHPDTFNSKYEEKIGEIGSIVSLDTLSKSFDVKLTDKPYKLTDNLLFLGEIPRHNDFEAKEPLCKVLKNGNYQDDYIIEDSALVYDSTDGIVIITGCSHSGICNIIEYAKNISQKNEIIDIIGGFHLVNPNESRIDKTIKYLKKENVKNLHPCHCTTFEALIKISKELEIKEFGVGSILEFEG